MLLFSIFEDFIESSQIIFIIIIYLQFYQYIPEKISIHKFLMAEI